MEQEEESGSQPVVEMSLDAHSFVQSQGHNPERVGRDESELDNEQQPVLDEAEVHVLYLNVPPSDEPQVLDLSNILVHEGIQVCPCHLEFFLVRNSCNTVLCVNIWSNSECSVTEQ